MKTLNRKIMNPIRTTISRLTAKACECAAWRGRVLSVRHASTQTLSAPLPGRQRNVAKAPRPAPLQAARRIPLVVAFVFAIQAFSWAQVVITSQPQSQTNIYGHTASLSVSAHINPPFPGLTYQWHKNSALIPGATGNTLSFGQLAYADAGNYFVEVFSYFYDTIASDTATLTVTPPMPGDLDLSFDLGSGANYRVTSVAVQSDDKVLIGGDFTEVNGTTRNRIARLNVDGSLDTNFNASIAGNLRSLTVQPDGKILVGGWFSSVNGTIRNSMPMAVWTQTLTREPATPCAAWSCRQMVRF